MQFLKDYIVTNVGHYVVEENDVINLDSDLMLATRVVVTNK